MRDLAGLVEDRERELSRLEGERLSDVMAHERLEAFDVLRLSPSRDIPFDLGDVDTTLRLLDAIRNAEPLKPPARTQPKVRLTRRPTCDFCLDGGEVRRMYVGEGFLVGSVVHHETYCLDCGAYYDTWQEPIGGNRWVVVKHEVTPDPVADIEMGLEPWPPSWDQ